MAQHIDPVPDKEGYFNVRYDDPTEDPHFGEQAESVENCHSRERLVLREMPHCMAFEKPEQIVGFLMARAGEKLPPGTVFEIRAKIPSDYGRAQGLCWYTVAAMQSWPLEPYIPYPGRVIDLGGYLYLGRFKT